MLCSSRLIPTGFGHWFGAHSRCLTTFREHKQILQASLRKVFVWGAGGEFQLATEKPQDGSAHPLEVEPLRGLDITSVTAGWVTTFALTSRGEVFGWGSNQFWSLPTSSADACSSHFVKPTRLALLHPQSKEPLRIKKVLAGRAHTLFLDHGGSIFSVGMSDLGQLGNGVQGESSFSKSPVAVEGPLANRVVIDIACGLDHNLALCRDGSVFSWGLAGDGQLGLGDPEEGKDIVDTPQQIQYMATGEQVPEIAKVVAGSDNSALLTKDGQLLMFGSNACQQLGISDEFDSVVAPFLMEGDLEGRRIVDVSLGGTCGFAIDEDRKVVVWGWNGDVGRLALPDSVDRQGCPIENPVLSALRPRMIRAGGGHTILVDHAGQFYSFGFGASGRLGLGAELQEKSVSNPTPIKLLNSPRSFSHIIDLAAGFDHNVLVVE